MNLHLSYTQHCCSPVVHALSDRTAFIFRIPPLKPPFFVLKPSQTEGFNTGASRTSQIDLSVCDDYIRISSLLLLKSKQSG